MIAAAVARPADAASCAATIAEASRERRTLRVRGAGTKDHLGELYPTDGVLETTALVGVVDHVPADLTVTVAAGTRLAEVQRALGERGQFLPLDPPHGDAATVGGILAAASDGFGRLRYGGVRDLVIGTATALADGTLARSGGRVVKNVAGYDLNKLLIGSLGTLGVVVEVTLRVLPLPEARALVAARCATPAAALAIADAMVRMPLRPAALVVSGRRRGWSAYVGAHGPRAQVERTMDEATRAAAGVAASTERLDDETALIPLRELPATAKDGALVRAALPLGTQRSFLESALALDAFETAVADAGTGVARVHLRGDDAAVLRGADALLASASALGGSARVERRDPALRDRLRGWSAQEPAGAFLMRRIKEAFDPAGILEPGRGAIG